MLNIAQVKLPWGEYPSAQASFTVTRPCVILQHSCSLSSGTRSGVGIGYNLKGIYPEFQVIRGFSQKIPADLLSYDKIQS